MEIIEGTTEFALTKKSAVAIGKFDGIHLGHQKLLSRLLAQRKQGLIATVFTFDGQAASFFGGEEKELSTKDEKRAAFAALGIDVLIEFPLSRETAATAPEIFVEEYLAKRMRAAYICAGPDLSFGRGGAGDYALLAQNAQRFGYRTELIEKVRVDGVEVSSTKVREAVRLGRMEEAGRMLGSPYAVSGPVEHGEQLGRTLGMPTANLLPAADKLLPPNGVYHTRVRIEGEEDFRCAISNVGCKPTVSDKNSVGIESYLYDFTGDLYGRGITVELLAFRRPEQKFASVEALREQIAADIAAGREFSQGACQKS
ncbi:MAG: riboflavin biosynthesis protein RibF [Bacteroidales bacterium]|nr:riboflavin biosynthesis protein RibF [Bacteroidales bacterium]MCM1415830.1 riboflavin biosynthesis protein RibF [bacterium]MCM1423593.1 riboflavin biosynthesis protein RibF [bacterium]